MDTEGRRGSFQQQHRVYAREAYPVLSAARLSGRPLSPAAVPISARSASAKIASSDLAEAHYEEAPQDASDHRRGGRHRSRFRVAEDEARWGGRRADRSEDLKVGAAIVKLWTRRRSARRRPSIGAFVRSTGLLKRLARPVVAAVAVEMASDRGHRFCEADGQSGRKSCCLGACSRPACRPLACCSEAPREAPLR